MYEAVKALITETSLAKFSVITNQQNCLSIPSPAPTRDFRMVVPENAKRHKKFWEELIAYFPLIRHGPHRKPSCCLATIGGYTDTHT
jgi:hypothetical protein